MKKYLLSVVTLAAFTGMSFAQPAATPVAAPVKTEKPAPKKAAAKKVVETFTGEITAVNAATNEITVKGAKDAVKTFTLEAAKMAGLAQGAKVKVTTKDGKSTVKAIKEHKGKKPEAPKAPAATPK
jgi:hypothetical protein